MDSLNNLLTEEQKQKIQEWQNTHPDGKMEFTEAAELLTKLGLNATEDEIKAADKSYDGTLSLDEFKAFVSSKIQERSTN
jgi:Ca2+-binding EF-hand superfamily protein